MSIQYNDPNSFDTSNPGWGLFSASLNLLKGVGANGAGPWVDTRLFKNMSVHVFGTFTASVQLQASNENTPAGTDTNAVNLGSAITTESMTSLTGPYRYVRAVVSGFSAGPVNAILHGCN